MKNERTKHGPLDTRTSRSHLTAYLSKDDGTTWTGGLMLDERRGVSYPDGQQTNCSHKPVPKVPEATVST